MVEEIFDVVIIGGGVAGFSSAIYTARQGLKTAIVAMDIGGQLKYADVIENYPGIESINGLDLVLKIQNHAISFGVTVFIDEVTFLDKKDEVFILKTRKGETLKSFSVIAACGKAPKRLNLKNEENFIGKGLSYCVICDGPLYRNKIVALNSFGEKGIESIHLLSSIAKEVIYIVPSKNDVSIEEAKKYSNVSIYPGYKVVELYGDKKLSGITITDNMGSKKIIEVDALFVELGFETKIEFLKPYVDINEKGEVVVDKFGATKTEGLFAAGDLVNIPYKQAVISAASGVIAALSAINYVNKKKGNAKSIISDWSKSKKLQGKVFRL
uniref:FAD-binding protein n=1 Tax=Ignisphaera aggregans TaxID=334771 RepID=A0A7C5TH78_9CREN